MRVAVIADMHGNAVALEAVLKDMNAFAPDQIVCLGDAIQSGPQPAEVCALLRERSCPVVMGNADQWLLTNQDSGAEQINAARLQKMNDVREWSLAQLSSADLEQIRAFQPTVEIPLGDAGSLLCYHGSPHSFDDVILPTTPEDDLKRWLEPFLPHLMTGGHTHLQFVRQIGVAFHFNPGSVGFAYRHGQNPASFRADPWAEYALLSVGGGLTSLEFRRVPFDVDALVAVYRSSGRPHAEDAIGQYQGQR